MGGGAVISGLALSLSCSLPLAVDPSACSLPYAVKLRKCCLYGQVIEGNDKSGVLCVKQPWPGMARTVFGDHQRYLNVYMKPYPGYYFTGDGCTRDKDGYYWITGRVDDVLNISGSSCCFTLRPCTMHAAWTHPPAHSPARPPIAGHPPA